MPSGLSNLQPKSALDRLFWVRTVGLGLLAGGGLATLGLGLADVKGLMIAGLAVLASALAFGRTAGPVLVVPRQRASAPSAPPSVRPGPAKPEVEAEPPPPALPSAVKTESLGAVDTEQAQPQPGERAAEVQVARQQAEVKLRTGNGTQARLELLGKELPPRRKQCADLAVLLAVAGEHRFAKLALPARQPRETVQVMRPHQVVVAGHREDRQPAELAVEDVEQLGCLVVLVALPRQVASQQHQRR